MNIETADFINDAVSLLSTFIVILFINILINKYTKVKFNR